MGRTGIAKAPKLMLRSWKQIQGRARISSKTAEPNPMMVHYSEDISDHSDHLNCGGEEESWVPHPRTGIFLPPGQESVLNDVPDGAASFGMTFWLRNVNGVDKPEPDQQHLPY